MQTDKHHKIIPALHQRPTFLRHPNRVKPFTPVFSSQFPTQAAILVYGVPIELP